MKPKLIVSDWNGTLITDVDDKPVLKQIAMDELKYAAKHLKLGRIWQLAQTKKKLEAMVKQYRDDPQSQAELLRKTFELYNAQVIDGIPMKRIDRSVGVYADTAVERLDRFALGELLVIDSIMKYILTSAYEGGVNECLRKFAFPEGKEYFWTPMERMPNVSGSIMEAVNATDELDRSLQKVAKGLRIRNYDDKKTRFLDICLKLSVSPESTVYMGDDFRDEPCAEVAKIFVVAPLASYEYRQHMASKYGSKVRTPGRANREVYKALMMD